MSEVRRQVALPPRPNWGWQDAAACRGNEVVLFFGTEGRSRARRRPGTWRPDSALDMRRGESAGRGAACPAGRWARNTQYGIRRSIHV